MYHKKGSTDLDVLRSQALQRTTDPYFPEDVTIHYHDKGDSCDAYKHEYFEEPKDARTE